MEEKPLLGELQEEYDRILSQAATNASRCSFGSRKLEGVYAKYFLLKTSFFHKHLKLLFAKVWKVVSESFRRLSEEHEEKEAQMRRIRLAYEDQTKLILDYCLAKDDCLEYCTLSEVKSILEQFEPIVFAKVALFLDVHRKYVEVQELVCNYTTDASSRSFSSESGEKTTSTASYATRGMLRKRHQPSPSPAPPDPPHEPLLGLAGRPSKTVSAIRSLCLEIKHSLHTHHPH